MPKYSDSIEIDGKYYCWDEKTDKIFEVDMKLILVENKIKERAIRALILNKVSVSKEKGTA